MMENSLSQAIRRLTPFDGKEVNVIIDTPKYSRNKYKFDADDGMFKLGGVLAAGHSFPYDFGFVPGTRGEDGDELDVLVLMDEPAFSGCLVKCRLIGGIHAEQKEPRRKPERNDRILAVASKSILYEEITSYADISKTMLDQIEHFFISYNQVKGKTFTPVGRFGAKRAVEMVSQARIADEG
jgi:inorganic pyrophosphatase